jgi:hypothetical protein
MARPARVRIRSRKPCVLARRRLFGWKVRFTSGLHRRRWQGGWVTDDHSGVRIHEHVLWSPRRTDPRYVARLHRVKPHSRGRSPREPPKIPRPGSPPRTPRTARDEISAATRRERPIDLWTSVEPIPWSCYRPGFDQRRHGGAFTREATIFPQVKGGLAGCGGSRAVAPHHVDDRVDVQRDRHSALAPGRHLPPGWSRPRETV